MRKKSCVTCFYQVPNDSYWAITGKKCKFFCKYHNVMFTKKSLCDCFFEKLHYTPIDIDEDKKTNPFNNNQR